MELISVGGKQWTNVVIYFRICKQPLQFYSDNGAGLGRLQKNQYSF